MFIEEVSQSYNKDIFDSPKQCIVEVAPSRVLVHVVRPVQDQDVSRGHVAHVADDTWLLRVRHVRSVTRHVPGHDVQRGGVVTQEVLRQGSTSCSELEGIKG